MSLFQEFMEPLYPGISLRRTPDFVNIEENDEEYVVTAELPGVRKEDLSISLGDKKIYVEAKKTKGLDENSRNFEVHFPVQISEEDLNAHLVDGVLVVEAKKNSKHTKLTKITIT